MSSEMRNGIIGWSVAVLVVAAIWLSIQFAPETTYIEVESLPQIEEHRLVMDTCSYKTSSESEFEFCVNAYYGIEKTSYPPCCNDTIITGCSTESRYCYN